jgi:transcriptional regulator with XRE-family HTH domain
MGPRSKLIAARKAKGLTQVELAALVGIGQSSLSKLEAGDHVPFGDTLVALCGVLDLSPVDLLERDAEESPQAKNTGTEG